jgi:hypothetical protein
MKGNKEKEMRFEKSSLTRKNKRKDTPLARHMLSGRGFPFTET